MLHEYAIDPKVLTSWSNFQRILSHFGYDRGRLILRLPKKWQRMVCDELGECGDIEKLRIIEALKRVKTKMTARRDINWISLDDWYNNAIVEYNKTPFRAIISLSNHKMHAAVLVFEDLDDTLKFSELPPEDPRRLWYAPTSKCINRNPIAIADAMNPFLVHAKHICFIDRHFDPELSRYQKVFKEIFKRITFRDRSSVLVCLEIHCVSNATKEFFNKSCKEWMPRLVPADQKVALYNWRGIPQMDKIIHNRYLLTDLGGLHFGDGLEDEEYGGRPEDHVSLLSLESCRKWLTDYSIAPKLDFSISPIQINGV